MINKKASGNISIGVVLAIALALVFIIFGAGGGIQKIFELGSFAKQIPVWVWVILIVAFIFTRFGKK